MENVIEESPAARVIRKCGGIERTAHLVGRHRSVVNRWLLPPEKGGTGGKVPGKHQDILLEKALTEGIDLRPDDFFNQTAAA